ncbi:MAG: DegT/DnrJ/EryC1/StrS family aminotransferase, partial [Patescibacteria group bacterium]
RYENLKPVFADIDETLCLDPESIKRKITARTKAVVYVGIGGNAGKLSQVKEICEANKLIFILDAAHMAGTYYQNKHVGSEADCAVFSFQAVKNLPTADGGMICFRDAELDKKARIWSWMGINKDTYARSNLVKGDYKWYYDVQCVGLNAHGNSVIASIGLVELKYLEQGNARRREICRQYLKYLSGQPEIGLIEFADDCLPSRHLFQIRVRPEWRDELMTYLNAKEIYPGVHYRVNTEYEMYRYALGSCPRAELAAKEVISLPLHLRLTDEEVAYVAQNVIEFLDSKK